MGKVIQIHCLRFFRELSLGLGFPDITLLLLKALSFFLVLIFLCLLKDSNFTKSLFNGGIFMKENFSKAIIATADAFFIVLSGAFGSKIFGYLA